MFYSKDKEGNETRCLSDRGLIGECFQKRVPCLKLSQYHEESDTTERVLLYEDSMIQQSVYTDNTIAFPIFDKEYKLLAIFEMSDSKSNFDDVDEQYFIRLIAEF